MKLKIVLPKPNLMNHSPLEFEKTRFNDPNNISKYQQLNNNYKKYTLHFVFIMIS